MSSQPPIDRGPDPTSSASATRRPLPVLWLLGGVAGLIVAAATAAVLLSQPAPPASTAASGQSMAAGAQSFTPGPQPATQPVQVAGATLPPFPEGSAADPAVGMPFPKITSIDFTGQPAVIDPTDGHPKLVIALNHACPHCQAEVPTLVTWLQENPLPANVELIAIATAINPNGPNYPPSAWLQREHWPGQALVDDAQNTAYGAIGLNIFPSWVLVASDGTVIERLQGEVLPDAFADLVAKLR